MAARCGRVAGLVTCLAVVLLGCTASPNADTREAPPRTAAAAETIAATDAPETPAPATTRETPTSPTAAGTSSPTAPETRSPITERPDPRRTRRAELSIPAIGVHGLRVVAYQGVPDDRHGTRIQNGGIAANPRGPGGGVGPGEVGNFIVTAHRLSAGGPFGDLPALRNGDRVRVAAAGQVYVYEIRRTMTISFRSERSKSRQTAEVPGHPGSTATRPMVTLSTCATPEDHAQGNYWSDEFGNPEHRIDKVGVLVGVHPA